MTFQRIKNFSYNLINLFRFNLKREISITQEEILKLRHMIRTTQNELLYFKILDYFSGKKTLYDDEIDYLKSIHQICIFPYKQCKKITSIVVSFDNSKQLPYVIHNNKKLFYPQNWSLEDVKNNYISLVEEQGILGGGFLEKAPHQYLTKNFTVNAKDIVLDIGAAEGLFSLDIIEKVKKVYIYESDKQWLKALTATFEPFGNKAAIINKLVSNSDSENSVSINSSLQNEDICSLFLKLDIEGNECEVLQDSRDLLNRKIDIRVACCTYHNANDASFLTDFFTNLDYQIEFSDGYMLFVHDETLSPPYFRRGLIRAQSEI